MTGQSIVIETDVLVIGGGSAALTAALEAKAVGVTVLLVSKGTIGRGGNTVVSGAGFATYIPDNHNSDSREAFCEDILSGGKKINQNHLVQVMVDQSSFVLPFLEEKGVKFEKKGDFYLRRTPPGHSYPRQVPTIYKPGDYHTRGLSITVPLREAAQSSGIQFLEKSMVAKLLKDEEGVCGAIAIDSVRKKIVRIKAKAVILATGGAGMIYERTNNTSDITGDGYALALEAGAKLIDMEFVQFYPTMGIKPLKMTVSTPLFGDGAILRNKNKERFIGNYDPAGDKATRDSMTRAIYLESRSGRGVDGGVYVDCSRIPKQILMEKHRGFFEFLNKHGLNPEKDWLIVAPTTHFFMGGVQVDAYGRSNVGRLYAAGEIVGGLHGANRLSGNALTETVVFGRIAGAMAAQHAKKEITLRDPGSVLELPSGHREIDIRDVRSALRKSMWLNASVVRSKDSLSMALNDIHFLKKEIHDTMVDGLEQLTKWIEVKRMLEISEVVVYSALFREESRGSHFRSDFPATVDSRWYGNIESTLRENSLCLRFQEKADGR